MKPAPPVVEILAFSSPRASRRQRHNDVVAPATTFGQRDDALRHRLHHAPVFIGIFVPVVHVCDAALFVVGDAVHGVAAEAKRRDLRRKGSSQIMRRGPFSILGARMPREMRER